MPQDTQAVQVKYFNENTRHRLDICRCIISINSTYVMLYGYLYSASRRRLFRGTLSVTGKWKEKSSNYVGTQMMFPVASHFGVQEEYHSKVQDLQKATTANARF